MITYRDMTFCVNGNCTKRCKRYLTSKIVKAAQAYGIPISVASFICLEQDTDGVYRHESEENE